MGPGRLLLLQAGFTLTTLGTIPKLFPEMHSLYETSDSVTRCAGSMYEREMSEGLPYLVRASRGRRQQCRFQHPWRGRKGGRFERFTLNTSSFIGRGG
jgi:hypothetical protein